MTFACELPLRSTFVIVWKIYDTYKFVNTYPLSTLYIPGFVRLFSYTKKHISDTNGIPTARL